MKVLVADKLPSEVRKALADLGFEVDNQPEVGADGMVAAIADAHVVVVRSTKVTKAAIEAGKRLQLIIRAGAGVDNIDCTAAARAGVFVSNTPGKNAIAVAELTMGLILALDRRIPDNVADLRRGEWNKALYGKAQGLYGRTLGLIGLGRIGCEVAYRARDFGMRVVAFDYVYPSERAAQLGVQACASVLELCAMSDVVSIHCSLGEGSRHLVGRTELAVMKPGALLVHAARGGIVDDAALAEAVAAGRIRAACDVFEGEPSGGKGTFASPLKDLPGFYGTHHIGASTEQAQQAIADEVVNILRNWRDTGAVMHCVNLSKRTACRGQLLVRHRDEVGVLASVLDVLRRANVNVQEMQNTIFDGSVAACAKISVEQDPGADVIGALSVSSPHILGVEWIPVQ